MSHVEEKKRTVDSCMSDLLQLGESVQSALETLPSPVATRNDTPMPVTGAPADQREQTKGRTCGFRTDAHVEEGAGVARCDSHIWLARACHGQICRHVPEGVAHSQYSQPHRSVVEREYPCAKHADCS